MKKGFLKAVLTCVMAAMLVCAACTAAGAEGMRKLVISEPGHLIGYLPLYVAIQEGYFAQEGLEVEVVQATGGAHVTAVVSGDAFAVIGGIDSICLANQGSSDPITGIVNCVNRANVYLFARKGLAPKSTSDEDMKAFLTGKIIVAGRYGGSPNLLTRYLLVKLGIDPDKDVTMIENADISTVNAMIEHGQGDIGNGAEPQVSGGITAGIWDEPFVKFPDLGDYSYSVISVKKSTIENDPETCQKVVSAMLKALKTVQENKDIAAEVLKKEFSTLSDEARQASLDRAYEDNLWSLDGIITPTAVHNNMDVVIKSNIFTGTYTYEGLVDMQFVEAAK